MTESGHHERLARHEDVKPPSEKSFGVTFAVVFTLLAAWLYWRKGLAWWPAALLAAAAFFLITAFAAPNILKPFNFVWLKFGLLLHRIVNPVVMGLLFFLVFTPGGTDHAPPRQGSSAAEARPRCEDLLDRTRRRIPIPSARCKTMTKFLAFVAGEVVLRSRTSQEGTWLFSGNCGPS